MSEKKEDIKKNTKIMGAEPVKGRTDTMEPEPIIGPPRGGLMKRTLKEMQILKIRLKDMVSHEGATINLSWVQIIRAVNFNAEKEVLRWDHTFEEAAEVIGIFLM